MSVNMLHQFSYMRRGAEGMLSRYVRRGEPVKPIGQRPECQAERATFIPSRFGEDEVDAREVRVAKTANLATHRARRS